MRFFHRSLRVETQTQKAGVASMDYVSLLAPLAGGAIGGVFGTYFSKRGEIRAIHRDLDRVVEQNKALTKAAEDIKSEISKEARAWEIKKDAAFEALAARV